MNRFLNLNAGSRSSRPCPWAAQSCDASRARRHRLLSETLDPARATAIVRRFQLALAWLTTGALLGLLIPFLGVAVIAAFNAFTGSRSGVSALARDPDATLGDLHYG